MKRIVIFLMVVSLITVFSITCFADSEAIIESQENIIEQGPENITEEANYTFLGRIWEYIESNKEELIDYTLSVLLLILGTIFGAKSRHLIKGIAGGVSSAINKTTLVTNSQNGVIESVNEMGNNVASLIEAFENVRQNEEARNQIVTALFVELSAVKQMLMTVYPNSKNLPQGVKDLINIENANCLKIINDNKALSDLYKHVFNAITAGEQKGK